MKVELTAAQLATLRQLVDQAMPIALTAVEEQEADDLMRILEALDNAIA